MPQKLMDNGDLFQCNDCNMNNSIIQFVTIFKLFQYIGIYYEKAFPIQALNGLSLSLS